MARYFDVLRPQFFFLCNDKAWDRFTKYLFNVIVYERKNEEAVRRAQRL